MSMYVVVISEQVCGHISECACVSKYRRVSEQVYSVTLLTKRVCVVVFNRHSYVAEQVC